ncbi:tumor necrosis factor ligand superfamily member 10 [Antechinus flavipes]|uniref:tumor necrosis factor ligand superfamily member 10 n=1 Tax=Antechinus flavipes TaxID=38775 RepID=UPI00223581A8|nr:tumor necrosis factor ligand superfamily member 10 [Antechinus flavipes]
MSLQAVISREGPRLGQAWGLLFLFSLLIQALLSATTYLYFSSELKQLAQLQNANSQSSLACLTKEYVGAMTGNRNSSGDTEEADLLCLQFKWQLQQLIKKELLTVHEESPARQGERENNPSGATERFNQSVLQRAAAHLTGSRQISPIFSRNSLLGGASGWKINYWESSRKGHSFLYNMNFLDGELIISQPGYYYIYSQTYFRFQELEGSSVSTWSEERKKQPRQLVQYIYKVTNYPEPILLLKSVKTSCWSKDSEYELYSMYQGGVFELKENERIFVSVSNGKLIDLDREASFFGAFLMG